MDDADTAGLWKHPRHRTEELLEEEEQPLFP